MVREGLLLAIIACPRPFQEGLVPAMLAGCGLACLYFSCAPHVHYSTIWYAKVPSLVSATCKPHNLQRDCAYWVNTLCTRSRDACLITGVGAERAAHLLSIYFH
jgi:hypothetical protein